MIAILGASGFVGSRLYYDLNKERDVVGTRYSDNFASSLIALDITDSKALKAFLAENQPSVIIHVANNPSSTWCKENPEKAKELNLNSTKVLVDLIEPSTRLVYISTMGAIEPSNFYQETKRASEEIIKESRIKYAILRPSIGFGVSPNSFKINNSNNIVNSLDSSMTPTFDTSLICQPTYLGHISEVIKKVIDHELWNNTIPISVEIEKSMFQIASDVLKSFGLSVQPTDTHKPRFNSVEHIDTVLAELGLPTMKYEKFIESFVKDIENRKSFVI